MQLIDPENPAGGNAVAAANAPRGIVSLRALLVGLIGVVGMCGLAPYNDLVVKNSVLVGSFFPLAPLAVLLMLLAVNAILHRLRFRRVLRAPELATVLVMMLVASAVPGFGLMRMLPGALSAFQRLPATDPKMADLMQRLDLPKWMLPRLANPELEQSQQATDVVVSGFIGRVPDDQRTAETWLAIAGAWAGPLIGWGVFAALLFAAIVFAAVILRGQWAEDERLPFPLAEVYVALLEPPARGRSWNGLLASPSLWIPAAAVFLVHATGGLSLYTHGAFPSIPLTYDVAGLFADAPWSSMSAALKSTRIFFSVIGICYFLQTGVSFSLWTATLLISIQAMVTVSLGGEFQPRMGYYQSFGAMLVLAAITLWTGRRRWADVLRAMAGRGNEDVPRYLSPAVAGWGLLLSAAGLAAWLMVSGAGVVGTGLILTFMAMLYLVVARVVAETGLMNVMLAIDLGAVNQMVIGGVSGGIGGSITGAAATRSYFWSSFFNFFWVQGLRESLPPFAINGLRVTDRVAYDDPAHKPARYAGLGVLLAIALALAFAYAASAAGALWTEYNYVSSIDRAPETPINGFFSVIAPESLAKGLTEGYAVGKEHERTLFFRFTTVGIVLTAVLVIARLRFAAWPLHPVTILLASSGPVQTLWLSLLVGWCAKVLLVRFGGATLFQKARPVFIGLILGEAAAAVFWLVVNLIVASAGGEFQSFKPMPGV